MTSEGEPKQRACVEHTGCSAIEVCNAFERAWQTGEPQCVESMVRDAPAEDRRALLYGLLKREISHRKLLGQTVTIRDYQARFPREQALLSALFPMLEQLRLLLERCGYELIEKIESGRTGDVYRAVHRREQRLYAVKIVPAFLVKPGALVAEEVVNLDYLLHQNLSRPTELIEADGNLLLFNEYVEGMNFGQLVEQFGKMPVGIACELVCQVAEGLQQLHVHEKAHGALTPTTMVVSTQDDETGVVKLGSVGLTDVADLSLSRFAQTQLETEFDWRLFAAPEVADHAGLVDPRCDLYSLGCILRYLLSGQCPQGSDSSQAKERIRVLWKRTTLTAKRGDVPQVVAEAIERMMAQDTTTRVARTGEVIETLRPFREQASYRELLSDVRQVVARRQRLTGGIHVAGPEIGECSDASSDRYESTPSQEDGFDSVLARTTDGANRGPIRRRSLRAWRTGLATLVAVAACVVMFYVVRSLVSSPAPDAESTLAEFTGTVGPTWFEELPWYTPRVRAEMMRCARDRLKPGENADIESWVESLWAASISPDGLAVRELQRMAASALASMDDSEATVSRRLLELAGAEQMTLAEVRNEYARLANVLDAPARATAYHLRALLRQASGQDQPAASDFAVALERYRGQASCLLPRCACDYAWLCANSSVISIDGVQVLDRYVLPYARTADLKIEALCCKAALLRTRYGNLSEAREVIGQAQQVVADVDLDETHPLVCRITEEKAWIAWDDWQLSDAQNLFQQAVRVRQQLAQLGFRTSGRFLASDRLGLASATQLIGDQTRAQSLLEDLLSTLEATTRTELLGAISPRRSSEWESLRPVVLTQLGDLYVSGEDYDYAAACRAYEQAVDGSQLEIHEWPETLVRHYRLAVARTLAGQSDEAHAKIAFADTALQRHVGHAMQVGSLSVEVPALATTEMKQLFQYRTVAVAALLLRSSQQSEQRRAGEALESVVNLAATDTQSVRLRMLAAQFLLESTHSKPPRAARVVERMAELIDVCSKDLNDEQRGFFRRYARLAHFAGLAAQQSGETSEDSRQLDQSLAVLEKAHRVFHTQANTASLQSSSSRLHTMAVGVSKYRFHSTDDPLNLQSAHADAQDLHAAFDCLRREDSQGNSNPCGIYAPSSLSCQLTDEKATRNAILNFVENLRRLPAADLRRDLVIISLSGHGLQDLDGSLYFLPHDYQPGSLLSTGLSVEMFQSKLRMLGANVLLIIDTCYSGSARGLPEQVVTRAAAEDVALALRRMTQSETALAVLVAGKARERAGESRLFGGHGALTAAVLEFLTQRQFDVETKDHARPVRVRMSSDGRLLTLEDLRRYVIDRVAQFPMIDQKPNLFASGDRIGDYWCGDIPLRFLEPESVEKEPATRE